MIVVYKSMKVQSSTITKLHLCLKLKKNKKKKISILIYQLELKHTIFSLRMMDLGLFIL